MDSRESKDSRIIPAPIVPITSKISTRNRGSKENPKFMIVNSTAIRIRPRRRSQLRVERGLVERASWMAMDVPARKTKAGAQKWVIHRVKKSKGVVTARLVGELVLDQVSRKSRVWSSAMMTMTRPRAISMEAMRFIGDEVTCDGE